jgi:hypothetical protein
MFLVSSSMLVRLLLLDMVTGSGFGTLSNSEYVCSTLSSFSNTLSSAVLGEVQ